MPTRSCVICRKKDDKSNLYRIVCDNKNNAKLDEYQKENKRAIYFCKDKKCIEKAQKILQKGKLKLKIGINTDSLEVLLNEVKNELGE